MAADACPKCGSPREPAALDCPYCGIVFARWRPPAAAAPASPAGEPSWAVAAGRTASEEMQAPTDPAEHNPYAPPRAEIGRPAAIAGQGVWRKGRLLVMRRDAELPGRCLRCNATTQEPRLRRKVYWHPPGFYLLILLNLLLYALIALLVRKKAEVMVPLCPDHLAARRRARGIAWLVVLACPLLAFVGFGLGTDLGNVLAMIGMIGVWIALIVALLVGRVVVPTRIDEQSLWLKGAGPEFLAGLPESPV